VTRRDYGGHSGRIRSGRGGREPYCRLDLKLTVHFEGPVLARAPIPLAAGAAALDATRRENDVLDPALAASPHRIPHCVTPVFTGSYREPRFRLGETLRLEWRAPV
jgi:hypothetical protein